METTANETDAAEQDNERSLFTGARYLNHAMRVSENMVAGHCKVHADAPLKFNVCLHNVQPGVRIDYATGARRACV